MAIMQWMRRTCTDARLDDLNAKVDRMDADMRAGFERLYRLMVQVAAIVIAALIGLIATISSVAITQL
jgi:signal transduction histidine kinase